MRRCVVLISILGCACGGDPVAGLARTPRPGDEPDPPSGLQGHFVSDVIGNCTQSEDWLSIVGTSFVYTLVDRNACIPESRGVFASPGEAVFPTPGVLDLRWNEPERDVRWSFTYFLGGNALVGKERYPGALYGPRSLWTTALHAVPGEPSRFRRGDERDDSFADGSVQHERVEIDLRLLPDLAPAGAGASACRLEVDLSTESGASSGSLRYQVPCRDEPVGQLRRITVAEGDQPYVGSAFPARAGDVAYRNLPRSLLGDPAHPEALLQENLGAPLWEVLGPPPDSAD